jgi:hypothetical protein
VKIKSPAIMDYYGFEDMKEFHPMNLRLGTIFFSIAIGQCQGLIMREKNI